MTTVCVGRGFVGGQTLANEDIPTSGFISAVQNSLDDTRDYLSTVSPFCQSRNGNIGEHK